jgi:hypothetical protein
MTSFRRPGAASVAVLIGLSASLVVAHAIAPDWSRRAGLDVWNLAAVERDHRAAAEERAEVYAGAERATARRATAQQIATKLVAGTSDLPTAADELLEVFEQDRGMRFVLETQYPAAPTERHRFARHAIDRVCRLLVDDPNHCAAVVARLEGEYRAMCATPESPPAP